MSSNIPDNEYKKKQKIKKRTEKNYELLFDYLLSHPCVDCDENNPIVLEFDHVHGKRYNISQMLRTHGWHDILKEIRKCEVRCSNCHRLKTAAEVGTRLYQIWKTKVNTSATVTI